MRWAPCAGADSREFVLKMVDVAADAESTDCLVRVLDHLAEQDPALPVPRLFPTLARRGGRPFQPATGSTTPPVS